MFAGSGMGSGGCGYGNQSGRTLTKSNFSAHTGSLPGVSMRTHCVHVRTQVLQCILVQRTKSGRLPMSNNMSVFASFA